MCNNDNKRFVYATLSQLNPEKWGGEKLEEKDDERYILKIVNYKLMQRI
jgi:hypothetical protein